MPKPGFIYEIPQDQYFTGIAVDHPKTNLNTGILLRTATCMGMVDWFSVIGEDKYPRLHSDTSQSYKSIPSFRWKDWNDFYSHIPECCTLVGVELCDRAKDIETFQWPSRCCIVLGGEDEGLSKIAQDQCRYIVKLPAKGCSMNLSSCGSMVLMHRYLQLRSKGYNI